MEKKSILRFNQSESQSKQVWISELFSQISPQQETLLLEQWNRLKNLMKETLAQKMLTTSLKDNFLQYLPQLTDEEIKLQCNQFQKQEISSSIQTTSSSVQKNVEHLTSEKEDKNKLKELNPEKEMRVPKEEDSEYIRIKRQLLDNLKDYEPFIKTHPQQLIFLLDEAFEIRRSSKIFEQKEIIRQAEKLKKSKINKSSVWQYIQLVDSALYHSSERHRLRETQILALLLFLLVGNDRMLLEILTGEGKSTTISCLAAILTISGQKVDIVTTSPLLAERDVEEKKIFYELMGLKACHNFEEKHNGPKECYYSNTIVYGTPHSFQVDILLNDYKKRNTRYGRSFMVLIVDEVDSMFIDQKQNQTLLATTYPGMSELVYPMKIIWNKINNNPIFKEDGKIKMAMALGSDKTVTGQAKAIMQEVVKDIREKFKNEIIPEWRQDFIDESLEKWIQSAIAAAFIFKEKKHYLVRNGKIVPVDFKNNGTLQENVQWQNGLHQFLQIKHGLTVNTEGMTSNFISNLGHFDKYNKIYGLTGTLGSYQSNQFLMKTYQVQLFKVPSFKERRLINQRGIVLYDETEWASYICKSVFNMLICQRSVLILCQTIQEVDLLQIALEKKSVKAKRLQVLKFGEEQIDDKIDCEEIVIATNLAGRGADLKITNRLNQRGGLHVIITFMPINQRVEMQGRGRAGRNGYDGSSELGINYTKHCQQIGLIKEAQLIFQNTELSNPHSLIEIRDQDQSEKMSKDEQKVERLRMKDKLFNIYCEAMNQIEDFQTNIAKQQALEEQWAMFLKRVDNYQLPFQILHDEATMLTEKLKNNSDDFYNPNHYILRGINQISNQNYKAAISYFKKAQESNPGTLIQIIGGMYERCCEINLNKGNEEHLKHSLKGLENVQTQIIKRKQRNQGFAILDHQNAWITNYHHQSALKEVKHFQWNIDNDQNEEIQERISEEHESSKIEIIQEVEQQKIEMSTAEDRILNGLSENIKSILTVSSQLKKTECLKIDFNSIDEILRVIEGDERLNKEGLQNLKPEGLKYLPEGVIQKKEKKIVVWCKRAGVFLLGVAQIIVGSLIFAETAGALTSFSITMMMEGVNYCIDALFNPEQLQSVTRYFTKTAITYAFSLASAGTEGIKQLGVLSQKGFQTFKEMPIKKFLESVAQTSMKGFKKMNIFKSGGQMELKKIISQDKLQQSDKNFNKFMDFSKSLTISYASAGVKKLWIEKVADPIKIVQTSGLSIRKEVETIMNQEQLLDKSMEEIRTHFQHQISSIISIIINNLDKNTLSELKETSLNNYYLNQVMDKTLKENLKLPQGRSTESQELIKLFAQKINSINLAELYAKHIDLEKQVECCLTNFAKNKNYDKYVKIGLQQRIKQSLQKVKEEKKSLIQSQKIKTSEKKNFYEKNRSSMNVDNYNLQVQNWKNMEEQYNRLVQIYNAYLDQHAEHKNLLEIIYDNQGVEKGKVKPQIIDTLPVHEYVKEALKRIQYQDCSKSFEENLKTVLFNFVGNYGLKVIGQIYESTNGSIEKLKKIAKMIIRK